MATLFTAAAILALGAAVLARARGRFVTFLFFVITVGASGWLAFFALMYGAASEAHAIAFARVASAFSSILPAATFHFAATYVGRRRALRNVITFCWMFCSAIALLELATPYFVIGVRRFAWGYYPIGSPYNISWVVIFAGMFATGIRMLWRAAQGSLHAQMTQAGFFGVQIEAPRSIMACAKSPARRAGVSCSASAVAPDGV